MKMIVYNSPEHAKERQNVTPPSVEEISQAIGLLNVFIKPTSFVATIFQRVIWHYENLNHFYTVVGGWEGLEKLQKANEWISVDDKMPEYETMVLITDGDKVYTGKRINNRLFDFNFVEEDFDRPLEYEDESFNSFYKGKVTHWKHLSERP